MNVVVIIVIYCSKTRNCVPLEGQQSVFWLSTLTQDKYTNKNIRNIGELKLHQLFISCDGFGFVFKYINKILGFYRDHLMFIDLTSVISSDNYLRSIYESLKVCQNS